MVQARKVRGTSRVLERDFHVDLFLSERPEKSVLFILFGGSGITRAEYRRRGEQVHPLLTSPLADLERELSVDLAFMTAPYDVPFADLESKANEASTERWIEHVRTEVLPLLPDEPFYLASHSGSLLLAHAALGEDTRCVGSGGLGADGLVTEFESPGHWGEVLTLYYNQGDRVWARNSSAIEELEAEGQVQCFRRLFGEHALADYVRNESLGGLVRRALRLAR